MATTHHMVTPNPAGHFDVLSGNSGKVYRVTPFDMGSALCTCHQMRYRAEPCSHVAAVREFAREYVKPVEIEITPEFTAQVFDRIKRSSR